MSEKVTERFLPEVQALRALAVGLVVIYHIWPYRLPGGFIGVDVFFVISGFLITAHLAREYESTGSISLSRFWARRIRRLLPAAFVVLAACTILAFVVLPAVVLQETLRQIAASAGYVLNWVLAADSVDYLAAGNQPTVVQHYWTLSVEEQFYIAWPLLVVAVALVVGRLRGRRPRASVVFGWTGLVVVALSLAYSVYLTAFSPSVAYFATTTRAWEFAAGGLLAVAVARWPHAVERVRSWAPVSRTAALTVLGVAIIGASSFIINGDSAFPGAVAAFPVIGTLLVILGGTPQPRPVAALTRWRPVQFLGDVSYSTYLWHWPLITTLVILLGRRPSVLEGVGLALASVALAAVTKYLVEDPARRSPVLTRRRLASFSLAAVGIVVFGAVWAGTSTVLTQQATQAQIEREQQIADQAGCFGANAMLGGADCPEKFVLSPEVDLTAAANDLAYQRWCLTWFDEDWRSCEFGDLEGSDTWAIVGDSHAASMIEALDAFFAQHDITLVTYQRYGCSGLGYPVEGAPTGTSQEQQEADCIVWSERVRAELSERDDISTVIYLNRTTSYNSDNRGDYALSADDIVATWQGVLDSGKRVISIKDWPRTAGDSIPVCLSAHVGETAPCSVPLEVGMPLDVQDAALAELDGRVESIDLTDAFCDETTCYSVIGDVVVYADHNHISGTYSRTLMPYLGPLLLGSR